MENKNIYSCVQFKSVEKVRTHICTVVLPNPGDHSPPHNNTPPIVKLNSAGLKAQVW